MILKNRKLTAAWDRVLPDEAADARMKEAVLQQNRQFLQRKEKTKMREKHFSAKKIIIPMAAVLSLAVIAGVILAVGMGDTKTYTMPVRDGTVTWQVDRKTKELKEMSVPLENGDTVTFSEGDASAASIHFDYEVVTRELTKKEAYAVSPLLTEATGTFRKDTGELIRLEGRYNDTVVRMAVPGVAVTDTRLTDAPSVSSIEGTEVRTGFFLTPSDRSEKREPIFSGEFQVGDIGVYAELGADYRGAFDGKKEIANYLTNDNLVATCLSLIIQDLIENGEPDFAAVTF